MPLRARLNDEDIYSYEFNEKSWNELKASYKKQTLMMPLKCHRLFRPKISKVKRRFFVEIP